MCDVFFPFPISISYFYFLKSNLKENYIFNKYFKMVIVSVLNASTFNLTYDLNFQFLLNLL